MDREKGKFVYFFRLFVGISIIVFLFLVVDLEHFHRPNELNIGYIIAAFLLVFLDRLFNAYRWSILINSKDLNATFTEIVKIYFKSNFLGLIMPSSVGGEFLKGYGLSKLTSKAIDSFSSVILERILGLIALTSICTGSCFFFYNELERFPVVIAMRDLSIVILMLTLSILPIGYFCFPFINKISWEKRGSIFLLMEKAWLSFYDYRKQKRKLSTAFLYSFLIQFLRIVFIWSLGNGLGITLESSYYFVFVPFVQLAGMIPLSVAGLGIEEGAFVYFFSVIGANPAGILGMAILARILTILSILPGGWIYLKDGLGPKVSERNFKEISC